MALDVTNPIPLHVQLKLVLQKEIGTGRYTERIPSERELMETYSVSRTTVREAVSSLVHEGVLEKIHGRGTFLANNHHTVNEWLGRLTSFTETVESMGMKPGIRLLSHGIAHDPKIIQILGQEECYRIERLRFADDAPVALERTNYPLEIGLKLARYDLDRVTLYTALEGNGIVLHTAEQRITAKVPSEQDARLLGIARNVSVLAAERVTYDPEGAIIEYYESIFRADKYAFCVRMHRQSTSIGLKEKSVRTI